MKTTEWASYIKGEVTCYNWKLNRVQARITEQYFINSFIDHVCKDNPTLLRSLDKLVLIGNGDPIAIYPKEAKELTDITPYLDSIKDSDIHTILISVVEDADMFLDSTQIDDILMEIKSVAKIETRYILID